MTQKEMKFYISPLLSLCSSESSVSLRLSFHFIFDNACIFKLLAIETQKSLQDYLRSASPLSTTLKGVILLVDVSHDPRYTMPTSPRMRGSQ